MWKQRVMMILGVLGVVGLSGCGIDPKESCSSYLTRVCPEGTRCGDEMLPEYCRPPKPPVQACYSDSDCGRGEQCVYDLPSPEPMCYRDGNGTTCAAPAPSGRCGVAPKRPKKKKKSKKHKRPTLCHSDSDCRRGQYCAFLPSEPPTRCADSEDYRCPDVMPAVEGRCQDRPVPPPHDGSCQSDSDCKRGEQCLYTGVPSDGTRRIVGRCAPIQPPPPPVTSCYQDSDCAADQRCEINTTEPVPPPVPQDGGSSEGYPCFPQPEGRCVPRTPPPTSCVSDDDCAQGEICYQIPCDAEHCGPAQCIAKPVEPSPRRCVADADCPSGQRCEHFATCTAIGCPPPPPSVCVDNTP